MKNQKFSLPPLPDRKYYYDDSIGIKTGLRMQQEFMRISRETPFSLQGTQVNMLEYPREREKEVRKQILVSRGISLSKGKKLLFVRLPYWPKSLKREWEDCNQRYCRHQTIKAVSDKAKTIAEYDALKFFDAFFSLLTYFDKNFAQINEPRISDAIYEVILGPVSFRIQKEMSETFQREQTRLRQKHSDIDFENPGLVEGADYTPV